MQKLKNRNTLLFITLVLSTALLSGCFFNPITGRYGPSWDVPLRIPLISNETTILELLEDNDFISSSDSGVLQGELTKEHTISFEDIEFTAQPIEIEIPPANISIPEQNKFKVTYEFDPSNLINEGTIESITFRGGEVSFQLNEGSNVTIDSFSLGGEKDKNGTINLNEITLTKGTEFTIECYLDSGQQNIKNAIVEFNITANDIESITGQNFRFKIPEEKFDLEFELPEEFDNLKFRNAELKLVVDYISEQDNAPEINLSKIDSSPLTIPEGSVFSRHGEFHFGNVTALLNDGEKELNVGGEIIIGENKSATFSFKDSLEMKFELIVPFEFDLTKEIIYESEIFPINIDKGTMDTLDKLTTRIHGEINLENHLPLGAKAEIYVSNGENPLIDDDAILIIKVELEAADTNSEGMAISAKQNHILAEIPDEIRKILKEEANAQLRLTIPSPQNDRVTFSQYDYIKISAWIELMAKVNK